MFTAFFAQDRIVGSSLKEAFDDQLLCFSVCFSHKIGFGALLVRVISELTTRLDRVTERSQQVTRPMGSRNGKAREVFEFWVE